MTIAFRAAISMSSRYASSRHINRLLIVEYVAAPDVVFARLYQPFLNQIDLPADDRLQLFLHLRPPASPRSPIRRRIFECNEEIDIAVVAKSIGQDGPE